MAVNINPIYDCIVTVGGSGGGGGGGSGSNVTSAAGGNGSCFTRVFITYPVNYVCGVLNEPEPMAKVHHNFIETYKNSVTCSWCGGSLKASRATCHNCGGPNNDI